jgi:hypothetical protein
MSAVNPKNSLLLIISSYVALHDLSPSCRRPGLPTHVNIDYPIAVSVCNVTQEPKQQFVSTLLFQIYI